MTLCVARTYWGFLGGADVVLSHAEKEDLAQGVGVGQESAPIEPNEGDDVWGIRERRRIVQSYPVRCQGMFT